ncbi:MAG: L,D-transpeptidase family protein [Novosphingobium sp.]
MATTCKTSSKKKRAAPRGWRLLDPRTADWSLLSWRHTAPALALLLGADQLASADPDQPVWDETELAQLLTEARNAPFDGLPQPDTAALRQAIRRAQPGAINRSATDLALLLAQQHLLGITAPEERIEWYIVDTDHTEGLPAELTAALREDRLADFFSDLRPAHSDYAALRSALASEDDPQRQIALMRTMERWRWLPRQLGETFVMANAAGFEVNLWRGGTHVKRWAAISGKASTQTPSLMAEAVAVNFNPWWEVPQSIAEESGMRAGGRYVWEKNRFRQPPGPGNALGKVKVIMPNSHNIYLHDTPSRGLFGAQTRAFSHGCMRVEDALGFAAALLDGARSRQQIDTLFEPEKPLPGALPAKPAEPKSTVVPLPQKVPVYVTYMTVTVKPDGALAFHKDIYGRDAKITSVQPRAEPQLALQ